MSKKEKINRYKQVTIDLKEFNALDNDAQKELVKSSLEQMWNDAVEVEEGHIKKVIKLSLSKTDDEMYLPKKLLAQKERDKITLLFTKKTNPVFLILLFGLLLLVGGFSATYSGFIILRRQNLNVDIDGDGVPDINIDTNGDDIADVNVDKSGNRKPDYNIDYKGNRIAIFNLDRNNNGIFDYNIVNPAPGLVPCRINCDKDLDGWPDYNIDYDGDGKVDLDIDINGDKVPDLNIDTNGDGKPDLNIDDVGDGRCHINCANPNLGYEVKPNGPSTRTGDPSINATTASLIVVYNDFGPIEVKGLFPDDQDNVDVYYPEKVFTITNESDYAIAYKLNWVVLENTFISENFKYKIESDNNGYQREYTTAPWADEVIQDYILIPAHTTQTYTVTFRLVGINEPQDYDQNRVFSGLIEIGD